MRTVQEHKPKFGEISDSFPEICTAPTVYGTLPSSAALAQAVDALNSALHAEFEAAETRLDQVARALDAVVASIDNTERSNVEALSVR
ncbi:MAG TPA: hypothetical protein VFV67_25645 [Actinophytocola sp.]|uniref:hypothetical protein n=1 Tax=Actinophytocola sp. TaxID=1872138 RepID=UPI002DBE6190|nr:hypothetical protein [Actinophytocola sp.]HEU5474043.1 hypothetical protein [Actinophytocola sp.]